MLVNEKPLAEISRELGAKRTVLYRWLNQHKSNPSKPFRKAGRPKLNEMSELARLKRENEELRLERDILKKAAAYFAKDLK